MKEAAIQGKNEEVMAFVIQQEAWKMWGDARVQWLRDTAVPALEKDGFREAIGEAYLCCFCTLWEDFREKEQEMLDYAAKDFDGLVETYYKPRWQMFFEEAIKAVDEKRPMEDLSGRYWAFECSYAKIPQR